MLFQNHLVVMRGGGDLATGVIYRLHKAGFPVMVLELERPLVVRRQVAAATAVLENQLQIEDIRAHRAASVEEALEMAHNDIIPVFVSPSIPSFPFPIPILIDARMAKRNIDTSIDQAKLVIALGPGFVAGEDCHAVVETKRGHQLGRVLWRGGAIPNTGTPGIVSGKGAERVLRAPAAGVVEWRAAIGDLTTGGQLLGAVAGNPIIAPFDGVVRGLIAEQTAVTPRMKIGDIDPRGDVDACFTISDKALAIGGGALEAILTYLGGK